MIFLDDLVRRHIIHRPDDVAMQYEGENTTYLELYENSHRLGHALIGAGVKHQDHVAILGKNGPEYLTAYFGCAAAGAIVTCVNYRLSDREFIYIITNSEANVLLLDWEFAEAWERIKGDCSNISRVIIIGENDVDGYEHYRDFIKDQPTTKPDVDVHEDDVALQMYTSGTTGVPKGAMLSHRNLVQNALSTVLEGEVEPGDTVLIAAPLYHMAAGINSLFALLIGGKVLVHREFNPFQLIQDIEEYRVTHTLLIPAMILFLINLPGIEEKDFSSLKEITYGASPIPYEVLTKAMDIFGCGFTQGYGQTETTAVLTVLNSKDHRREGERGKEVLKSAGREILGCEVKIVDDNGSEVERGVWGEIIGRGPNIMKGYWKMPDKTAETIKDGWLWTGDIGYQDEEGYIYIVDRSKDMIISGGENIYPREIEEVLFTHEGIADAAVIGVPNSDGWGEEVKACVVLKPETDLTEREIIDFCRDNLAHFKCPKTVDLIGEIPRNLSGKVLKKDLRAPYWEGKERQVN